VQTIEVDEGNLMEQAHEARRAEREDRLCEMMASRQPPAWLLEKWAREAGTCR
jgi:hypothetical protein